GGGAQPTRGPGGDLAPPRVERVTNLVAVGHVPLNDLDEHGSPFPQAGPWAARVPKFDGTPARATRLGGDGGGDQTAESGGDARGAHQVPADPAGLEHLPQRRRL